MPKVSAPSVGKHSVVGGPRFQKSVRSPTNFPHVKVSRRDYSKGEQAAENPLGQPEASSFGDTGLSGET